MISSPELFRMKKQGKNDHYNEEIEKKRMRGEKKEMAMYSRKREERDKHYKREGKKIPEIEV